jgi:hypothetical protein
METGKRGARRGRGDSGPLRFLLLLLLSALSVSAVEIKWTPAEGDPPEPYSAKHRREMVGLPRSSACFMSAGGWMMRYMTVPAGGAARRGAAYDAAAAAGTARYPR